MISYKAVSWDGEVEFFAAWTYSEAQDKAYDMFGGNLKTLEED